MDNSGSVMITVVWECFVEDFSSAGLSFSGYSWFFGWSSRNMVLPYLKCNSLHSRQEGGESEVSRISKNCIGLLLGFIFGYAGNWDRIGGGAFGGNWSGGCNDGWFCNWGTTPIGWLFDLVGCCQLWDHIGPWVDWFSHWGGYQLFNVLCHNVVGYCWFIQEGPGND